MYFAYYYVVGLKKLSINLTDNFLADNYCSACDREHSVNLLASYTPLLIQKLGGSLLSNQLYKPKRMSNSFKAKIHISELIYMLIMLMY